jgi:hypothetical protein
MNRSLGPDGEDGIAEEEKLTFLPALCEHNAFFFNGID